LLLIIYFTRDAEGTAKAFKDKQIGVAIHMGSLGMSSILGLLH
jgi:hypothetical protein